jgi:hypothetical protein
MVPHHVNNLAAKLRNVEAHGLFLVPPAGIERLGVALSKPMLHMVGPNASPLSGDMQGDLIHRRDE